MRDLERPNIAGVRKTLKTLGAVVAEVDRQLRYVWIDNPHPDFDAKAVVGKRDDELLPQAEADGIMSLKRETFDREAPVSAILTFKRSDGLRYYSLFAYPIRNRDGEVDAILTVGFDVPARQPSPSEQTRSNNACWVNEACASALRASFLHRRLTTTRILPAFSSQAETEHDRRRV